jgi:OOP family OmpA-OmpF porin
MAQSLFASLLRTLDQSSISEIASPLGESEPAVARGLEASMASVLGALAGQADDPGALRRMLNLASGQTGDISWSRFGLGLSSPGFAGIAKGKHILAGLFGADSSNVANAIGIESGLGTGTATTLLAIAAPMTLRFLSRRAQDEGLSLQNLGAMLQRETPTLRSALPEGLSDLLWASRTEDQSPVIAQSIRPEPSSPSRTGPWALGVLMLGAFAICGAWLWSTFQRPIANVGRSVKGEASRMADDSVRLGGIAKSKSLETSLPDMDRLKFDTGSSTLRPASSEQLDRVAAALKDDPNAQVTIAGYTDNVGPAERNLELSRARAETVKGELISRGITANRLTTEGLGEQSPLADNGTADGRQMNRRVTLQATQK